MNNSDMGNFMKKYKRRLTRARSIKVYCKEMCCAGDNVSWRDCSFTSCPLWRFRKGKEILTHGSPLNSESAKKLRKMRGFSGKNNTQEADQ